ncbi:MAG TPA: hypothetical protein PLN34_00615 [Alloprevotella sp.]|nr:hypothetical protein [Alloprevotella sp.]
MLPVYGTQTPFALVLSLRVVKAVLYGGGYRDDAVRAGIFLSQPFETECRQQGFVRERRYGLVAFRKSGSGKW